MEEVRNMYKVFARKPWRPRHKGEDNSKMDLREIGCEGVHWIEMTWDRIQWWATVSTVTSRTIM
jgi:hypothetical protein